MSEAEEVEVNMTPMLDIVFIMLIFFIVTAVFVKQAGVEISRPEAVTASSVKRIAAVIGIDANSEIWIDKQVVPVAQVRQAISQFKRENPKGNVVVQADKNADAGVVVTVIEQLNLEGIAGVSLATQAD